MKRLGEDTHIENFDDPTPLNFDNWLSNEMNKTGGDCQKGKTSYQLMMNTFGKPSIARNMAPTASAAARSGNSTAVAAPPNKLPSTEDPELPSKAHLVRTSKDRMSKVQRLGWVVRENILMSSQKQTYHRSTKKVSKALF